MFDVVVYSKIGCPFCRRAKQLLAEKNVDFTEIDILEHPDKREEMIERAEGNSTVPQIFINNHYIGGCSELLACEEAGKLDNLLGLNTPN